MLGTRKMVAGVMEGGTGLTIFWIPVDKPTSDSKISRASSEELLEGRLCCPVCPISQVAPGMRQDIGRRPKRGAALLLGRSLLSF